jgi:type I restriction-modification system DNA methylase subunit
MENQNYRKLIFETKQSCVDYLPKLIEACDKITENIQANNHEWFEIYEAFLEGLSWLASAISSIQNIDDKQLREIEISEFNKILKAMEDALFQKDYILLGDLLEYELKDKLENYYTTITRDLSA